MYRHFLKNTYTQHSLLKMAIPESAVSPLEKILKNPGLVHLAENIFDNLCHEDMEVYRDINQSLREIFDKLTLVENNSIDVDSTVIVSYKYL